ncbi:MAG: PE family protein [Mycobacterium sp.]
MSFVMGEPEMLSAASGDLAGVGSVMAASNKAAAVPTTGVVPPAMDAVSNIVAAQFALHAQKYQAIAAMAEQLHSQVVSNLATNANVYAAAEAANATNIG